MTGSNIIANAGDVLVTGIHNGFGTGSSQRGLHITTSSSITAVSGDVIINATAGQGSGGNAVGVDLNGSNVSSVHGNVLINVTGETSTGSIPLVLTSDANIVAKDNINLISDDLAIGDTSTITSTSGVVTIRPKTSGNGIDLGTNTAGTLGLTDGELDRIVTGALEIGDSNSGSITVSGAINRSASTAMVLSSAGSITFTTGSVSTSGGTLSISAATGVTPASSGVEMATSAAATIFTPSQLNIAINGAAVDTGYQQLNANGAVHLAGLTLKLSGTYIPSLGQSFVIVNRNGGSGYFAGLPEGATLSHFLGGAFDASITYSGGTGDDVVLIVTRGSTFRAGELIVSPSDVRVPFNDVPDFSSINIYDGVDVSVDAADVTLVGATVGTVRGSLVWDATTNTASFVKTGGPLAPDTYTLTFFSRADGWKTSTGVLLDGDFNCVPGGDLVRTFTVATSTARTVSLSDFARGATSTAGQNVNLSFVNGNPGIPVTISDGAGVLAIDFDIAYNPSMLNFSSSFFGVLPAGWTTTVNLVSSGRMRLFLSGTTPLPAGPQIVTRLLASVPANTPYGASDLVRIENLSVFTETGGNVPVPSIADVGLHKAIFVGDTNGDGLYTAQDAGWVAGVVVGAFTGFDAYSWTDPTIVANVNQNAGLDGLDASWIARKGLSPALQPEIPNLPAGGLIIPAGIDPTIAADSLVTGARGSTVNVPIRITDNAAGLFGVDVFIDYNTNILDLVDGLNASGVNTAGMFASEGGWTIDSFVDDASGKVRIAMYRASASTSSAGIIANVPFSIKPDAAFGESPILVDGNANVPPFTFTFISGSVNILNSPPTDIILDQNQVNENINTAATDLLFGQLDTEDLDPIDTYLYELVSGTGDLDNGRFRIVDDKIFLKQGETLDFETKPNYTVRVRSTDSGGAAFTKQLSLIVTDVDEPVELTIANSTVTGDVFATLTNSGTWSDPEDGTTSLSASMGIIVKNNDGTWNWSYKSTTKLTNQTVTISASDGTNQSTVSFTIDTYVIVTRSSVYYKGSSFSQGGNNVEAALDTSKVLAKAGNAVQTLSFANLINTTRGINGLIFDLAALPENNLTSADFEFRMSPTGSFNNNANPPSNWQLAPNPTFIGVSANATNPLLDRVRIEWADNAIANRWLQIRIRANENTGLRIDQVYYLGHLQGEVNGSVVAGNFFVTTQDQSAVLPLGTALITDPRDLDKNRFVTTQDLSAVRQSINAGRSLRVISIPMSGSGN